MGYKNDYKKSRKAEIEFEHHLQHYYNIKTENSANKGYFPDWDISSTAETGHITKYEVKYNSNYFDVDFPKGTVVIEAARIVDKMTIPCGLTLTKADYYVFQFQNDSNFYLIKVDTLKQLVANSKLKEKKIIYDKNNYQLHIFNKAFILQYCIII